MAVPIIRVVKQFGRKASRFHLLHRPVFLRGPDVQAFVCCSPHPTPSKCRMNDVCAVQCIRVWAGTKLTDQYRS